MSDFQIELSILCQYFWSIKPINEPILPKMDEISPQRFSREVPGNIKPLTKLTDKWTSNFETWRLKKSIVIKTTTHFFLYFFLISFKPTGNSTTMLVRTSLLWPVPILATNRLTCAIYPNLCCITKILHFSYIHSGKVYDAINWANMGVVTLGFSGNWHHSSKIIYATFFRRFAAESICSIERLTCASSKTRLFPSALKRSNVSISRTEKKNSSQCNKENRYTEICEYSIRGARTCDNWKRDFLGWAHSGTTDLHMTNQSKV